MKICFPVIIVIVAIGEGCSGFRVTDLDLTTEDTGSHEDDDDTDESTSISSNTEFDWLGDHNGDRAGASISVVGDTDNDGEVDFLVGAPGADLGGVGSGVAYLLRGPSNADGYLDHALTRFVGSSSTEAGGWVAGASDVNLDGFDDVLIGSILSSDPNRWSANIHLSPLQGLILVDLPWLRLETDRCGPNNEGLANPAGGLLLLSPDCGELFFLRELSPGIQNAELVAHARLFSDPQWEVGVGRAISDVTDDGRADVILGAPGPGASSIYVLPGPLPGGDLVLGNPIVSGNERLGEVLVSGVDTNGDGSQDLVLGDPIEGAVRILLGPVDIGETQQIFDVPGVFGRSGFGANIVSLGDLDGDLTTELAVVESSTNTVWLIHGDVIEPRIERSILTEVSIDELSSGSTSNGVVLLAGSIEEDSPGVVHGLLFSVGRE